MAHDPGARITFVPSGDMAVDVLRKDIASHEFYLCDLGLTPRLIKTLNDKAKTRQKVTYLDHHEQSELQLDALDVELDGVVRQGVSAAGVAYDHLGLNGEHRHLVALADLVEYCDSPLLGEVEKAVGMERLEEEARMLDFAWRYRVDDDRFRYHAARKLAAGKWPSEVSEVKARYHQMVNENRWDRALERVRERIELKHNVALLRFGRHKTSLFGFGSRALTEVAKELGASVAVMLNRRNNLSSLSMRATGLDPDSFNLGQFVSEFTAQHGIVGGGHPNSAGAKIPTASVPAFLHEVYCFA
ncbi:MAG TPA: DHHA1 domain-containing protein [Candidatus Thermoplasmatota archaeon]|nr:DHHA1 domain-containing protein [Candidatus Thermoplasmatota archaeon]